MAITLSAVFANLLASHNASGSVAPIADQIGGGSLIIYSGTPPTGANEALSGNTVLATFTFNTAATLGSSTAGVLTLSFSSTTTVTASASGTATFFRILNTTPAALIQGAVATSASDWNLTNTSINSGDQVTITGTPTITVPVT